MARKAKSRKYKSRNEFRYTKNKITTRHPRKIIMVTLWYIRIIMALK